MGADKREIEVIKGLAEKGKTVAEISAWTNIHPSGIEQHLPKKAVEAKPKKVTKKKAPKKETE